MKVLVVHPGDSFSTHDVYTGLCAGLVAQGAEVVDARLDYGIDAFSTLIYHAEEAGAALPEWAGDAFALAAPRVIAQAAWLQPDAAIVVTGLKLHYSVPLALRRLGVPTALLCTETPYSDVEPQIAPLYDHVFTHERTGLRTRFGGHPSAHYLPHAYNPAVHRPDGPAGDPCDVYFVGTAFPERRALFGAGWGGVNFVCEGALWQEAEDRPLDAAAVRSGKIDPWEGVRENAAVAARYRSAAICLNHHRTTTDVGTGQHIALPAESLGPRAYEIAACGGFQLCDDSRAELVEIFGDTLPTYRAGDAADLDRKIRYWLARPGARSAQARAQHEAAAPHSWHARARQILEVIAP